MLKIQIIYSANQLCYRCIDLAWVKLFADNLEKYYPSFNLNTFEVRDCDNVLDIYADLFIRPISSTQIKVGFRPSKVYFGSDKFLEKSLYWLNISKMSEANADALSLFLILVLGLAILPSAMGGYNTDCEDLINVMQKGENAFLINLQDIDLQSEQNVTSIVVWLNSNKKYSQSFNNVCNMIKRKLKSRDVLSIINITNHLVLKDTSLALVVKK